MCKQNYDLSSVKLRNIHYYLVQLTTREKVTMKTSFDNPAAITRSSQLATIGSFVLAMGTQARTDKPQLSAIAHAAADQIKAMHLIEQV